MCRSSRENTVRVKKWIASTMEKKARWVACQKKRHDSSAEIQSDQAEQWAACFPPAQKLRVVLPCRFHGWGQVSALAGKVALSSTSFFGCRCDWWAVFFSFFFSFFFLVSRPCFFSAVYINLVKFQPLITLRTRPCVYPFGTFPSLFLFFFPFFSFLPLFKDRLLICIHTVPHLVQYDSRLP